METYYWHESTINMIENKQSACVIKRQLQQSIDVHPFTGMWELIDCLSIMYSIYLRCDLFKLFKSTTKKRICMCRPLPLA